MIDESLSSIAGIEGVAGVVAFSAAGAVIGAQPAGLFDAEALGRVGRSLAELSGDLELLEPLGVRALDLDYRDARLLLQPLRAGVLGVLCAPGCNPALVRLRLRLAARALETELNEPPQPQPVPSGSAPVHSATERLTAIVRDQLGAKATRALELLEAAAEDPAALEAAIGQIGRFTRLFVSSERAAELERALVEALAGSRDASATRPHTSR